MIATVRENNEEEEQEEQEQEEQEEEEEEEEEQEEGLSLDLWAAGFWLLMPPMTLIAGLDLLGAIGDCEPGRVEAAVRWGRIGAAAEVATGVGCMASSPRRSTADEAAWSQ